MARQAWADGFVFVDAFAGAGRALVRQPNTAPPGGAPAEEAFDLWSAEATDEDEATSSELSPVLDGSPAVALGVTPPFTRYVFLEREPARVQRLGALQTEFSERDIVIHQGDSNEYLCNGLVRAFSWSRWRAVVFVDPFELVRWVAPRRPIDWVMSMVEYLPMSAMTREDLMWRFGQVVDDPEIEARRKRILEVMLACDPATQQRIAGDGRVAEAREALHRVLAQRQLAPTADEAARIEACTDLAALRRWHERAVTAASVADAIA